MHTHPGRDEAHKPQEWCATQLLPTGTSSCSESQENRMKGGTQPSTFQAAHVYEKVLLQVVENPGQRVEIAHTVLWEVHTEIEDREITSLTVALEPKI